MLCSLVGFLPPVRTEPPLERLRGPYLRRQYNHKRHGAPRQESNLRTRCEEDSRGATPGPGIPGAIHLAAYLFPNRTCDFHRIRLLSVRSFVTGTSRLVFGNARHIFGGFLIVAVSMIDPFVSDFVRSV